MTDECVASLKETNIFSLFVPKSLGGAEVWPVEGLEIVETLSRADASTGWVVMAVQVSMASCAAYLAPSAAKAVFKTHVPIIAGHGAPNGRADVEQDGYRLSGNWSYGSGLLHSEWIHTGAIIHHDGRRGLLCLRLVDQRLFERVGRCGRDTGEKARIEAERDGSDAREDSDTQCAPDPLARTKRALHRRKEAPADEKSSSE